LTRASSIAITSQCKINLRLGSVFYFGTISSIADEKATLHRIVDPPKTRFSPEIPRKAGARQQIVQPPAPLAKTTSCKPKVVNLPARRTPLNTSPMKEWTWIKERKKQSFLERGQSSAELSFRHLRPQTRTERSTPSQQLLSTPTFSSLEGDWNHLRSPTTSRPCKGKNLPSVKRGDKGPDARMFGDIMRPGSRIQRNPYPEVKFQK
jgi:hypothetical protein